MDLDTDAVRFSTAAAPTPVILEDSTVYDLNTLVTAYSGRRLIERLLFIARSCPSLAVDAYKLALDAIKSSTFDYQLYSHVIQQHNQFAATNNLEVPVLSEDDAWINTAKTEVRNGTEKLDTELKNYQNNLIKESIRMAHRDIGDFKYKCGKLTEAFQAYTKVRDYCSTTQHSLEMCLNIIPVALDQSAYSSIASFVTKAETALDSITSSGSAVAATNNAAPSPSKQRQTLDSMQASNKKNEEAKERDRNYTADRLAVASGVAALGQREFAKAARQILKGGTGGGKPPTANDPAHFIAPGDMGLYATLCGLAVFDRGAIKRQLVENSVLRPLLEQDPHLKTLISSLMENRYKEAFEILDRYTPRYLLDIHLSTHVEYLVSSIRSRALIQYFQPYSTLKISKMATTFGLPELQIEQMVIKLIKEHRLAARIDCRQRVLKAYSPDQRSKLFAETITLGQDMEKDTKRLLQRMKMIEKGLIVQPEKKR